MMERAADAWEHNQFKDVVVRVANVEMWVPESNSSRELANDILMSYVNSYYKVCWHECQPAFDANVSFRLSHSISKNNLLSSRTSSPS